MTIQRTAPKTITLPSWTGPHEVRTGGLTDAQVATLLEATAEPGVYMITPMDGLLSDARRPRTWTILTASRSGGPTRPLTIKPDGSTR